MWPAGYISVSLAYIGMWGRGEVGALVSFSIHVSKPYIMAGVIGNYCKLLFYGVVRFLQAEVSQNEIHCRLVSAYGQNVFRLKEVFVWCNKFTDGRTELIDDLEEHRGRPRTSHTDENYVIVECLIKKDRRFYIREKHCKKDVFPFLGK
jgi:hypothetical protein